MLTMPDEAAEALAPEILAVACPGGMARQLRVQVPDESTPSRWRHVGSFRDSRTAAELATRLRKSGTMARIVRCNHLPTGT
ncbi:MAG: hypothetical protein MUF06_08890 [Pirellulaceae bacterium]|jgi:hypothetical protein|nr:hypothetical protein [Pirellulaceae bacterium]